MTINTKVARNCMSKETIESHLTEFLKNSLNLLLFDPFKSDLIIGRRGSVVSVS